MKVFFEAFRKHSLKIVFAFAWASLFLAGIERYAGSKTLYILFSLVSLALLLTGTYRVVSFGYLFVSIFLWLGFWFKLSANFLIFGHFPFGEPVGGFDSSADAWDLMLSVAIAASLGMIFGGAICRFFRLKPYAQSEWARAPFWYSALRKWLWTCIIVMTLAGAAVNTLYGIHQVGLAPRTIFPWPTNALLAWFMNIGAALFIAVMVCWDTSLRKNLTLPVGAMLFEAFLSTVSVMSRAIFSFHFIPQILALSQRKAESQLYSRNQTLLLCFSFILFFLASIAAVSYLRDFHYASSNAKPTPDPVSVVSQVSRSDATTLAQKNKQTKDTQSFRWILFHQLLVNRWIGIEGAMAISSYSKKSNDLLWSMVLEKHQIDKVSAYQEICNSGYQSPDPNFRFASVPGMSGFLFYSGSLWVVFFGMMGIASLIFLSERAVFSLTLNPIVCSLYGIMLANSVAQFGITPRQDIPQYLMIFIFIAGLSIVQRMVKR